VARYAFDNSLRDSLVGQNDLAGSATYLSDRNAVVSSSLNCTGNTQLTASFALPLARDFSTTCWIRPRMLPVGNQLHSICVIEAGASLYFSLGINGDSGIGFRFASGGSDQPFVSYRPSFAYLDTWVHLAVTRANSVLRLYVNGIVRDTAVVGSGFVDGLSNPILVGGSSLIRNFGLGGFYNGSLDEFRIYNRPLNQAEIDTLSETILVRLKDRPFRQKTVAVWDVEVFRVSHPDAQLITTSGKQLPAAQATRGLYVWYREGYVTRVMLL
jgi:hypothetical protein